MATARPGKSGSPTPRVSPQMPAPESKRKTLALRHARDFGTALFEGDMHAKRVRSLSNGVAGVLNAAMMTIHTIGQAYAAAAHIQARNGVKQIDRLLSNVGVDIDRLFPSWIRFVVGVRSELVVALDWTEFDDDDHATLCAYAITRHGRATPLLWKTYKKSEMEGKRTGWEHDLVEQFHEALSPDVRITLLADRGFGDQRLYALLTALGWDYVIRFRGCILLEDSKGETRPAIDWLRPDGRAVAMRGVKVTDDKAEVPTVVLVHASAMKEAWFLASSLTNVLASEVVKLYGRRFTIEETFRDQKDIRFGLGLSSTHIGRTDRRDRLLFLFAIAHALLTLLGAASEAAGLDKTLKSSVNKHRTHSLFWQGTFWYRQLSDMRDDWFSALMGEFDRIVREHEIMTQTLGFV